MAITTVGGSGTTSSAVASGAGADLNLFTTPNTANMIFNITVIVAGGSDIGTADVAANTPSKVDLSATSANSYVFADGAANASVQSKGLVCTADGKHYAITDYTPGRTGKTGVFPIKTIKMKVGPNTAVHVPVFNSDSSTRTIYVSWNYCGIAIS